MAHSFQLGHVKHVLNGMIKTNENNPRVVNHTRRKDPNGYGREGNLDFKPNAKNFSRINDSKKK